MTDIITSKGAQPSVAFALVNWNGWQDTLGCLASIGNLRYRRPDIVLYDNASTDSSVERIRRWADTRDWQVGVVQHPTHTDEPAHVGTTVPQLLIVQGPENSGFARGTNLAIRYALCGAKSYRYIWVLNTDTIVDEDALSHAVNVAEHHSQIGAVQSLLLSTSNRHEVDSAGLRLLKRGGAVDLFHGRSRSEFEKFAAARDAIEIFGACAASALYSVNALRAVGVYDEAFWSMSEDVDLACRLRANGYRAMLARKSIVWHRGGMSRAKKRGRLWWIAHRNRLRIVARWYPRVLGAVIVAARLTQLLLAAVVTARGSVREWREVAGAVLREYRGGAKRQTRQAVLMAGMWRFDST